MLFYILLYVLWFHWYLLFWYRESCYVCEHCVLTVQYDVTVHISLCSVRIVVLSTVRVTASDEWFFVWVSCSILNRNVTPFFFNFWKWLCNVVLEEMGFDISCCPIHCYFTSIYSKTCLHQHILQCQTNFCLTYILTCSLLGCTFCEPQLPCGQVIFCTIWHLFWSVHFKPSCMNSAHSR